MRKSARQRDLSLFIFLSFFLMVTQLPLGSNRPLPWLFNAVVLAVAFVIYFGARIGSEKAFRFSIRKYQVPVLIFIALLAWMAFQVFPIAAYLPEGFALPVWAQAKEALDLTISETLSILPRSGIEMMIRYVSYGLLFILVMQYSVLPGGAERIASLIFWIVAVEAFIGLIWFYVLGDKLPFFEKLYYHGYATGTYVNRNNYSGMLAYGLALGASRIMSIYAEARQENASKAAPLAGWRQVSLLGHAIIPLTMMVAMIIAQLSSGSRAGLALGMVGMVMVVGLGLLKNRIRRASPAFAAALAFLIVIGGIGFIYGQGTFERLGSADRDLDVRQQLYEQVGTMIQDRPFSGFGAGTFEYAYYLFHQAPVSFDFSWDRAHNTYLELMAELGVIGGLAPVLILLILGWPVLRDFFRRGGFEPVTSGALAVLLIGALHALVDFTLQIEGIVFLFLATLAAAVGKREVHEVSEGAKQPAESQDKKMVHFKNWDIGSSQSL